MQKKWIEIEKTTPLEVKSKTNAILNKVKSITTATTQNKNQIFRI